MLPYSFTGAYSSVPSHSNGMSAGQESYYDLLVSRGADVSIGNSATGVEGVAEQPRHLIELTMF